MLSILFADFDSYDVLDRYRYIFGINNASPAWAKHKVWEYVELNLLNGRLMFPNRVLPKLPEKIVVSVKAEEMEVSDGA